MIHKIGCSSRTTDWTNVDVVNVVAITVVAVGVTVRTGMTVVRSVG